MICTQICAKYDKHLFPFCKTVEHNHFLASYPIALFRSLKTSSFYIVVYLACCHHTCNYKMHQLDGGTGNCDPELWGGEELRDVSVVPILTILPALAMIFQSFVSS